MITLSKNAVAVKAIKGFANGSAKSDAGKKAMRDNAEQLIAEGYPSTYFAPIDVKEGKVSVNTSGKAEYDNAKLVIAEARLTDNQLRLYKADADDLPKAERKAKKQAMSRVNRDIGRLYGYMVDLEIKSEPEDVQAEIKELRSVLKFKEELTRASRRAEDIFTEADLKEATPHMTALIRLATRYATGETVKQK